MAENYSHGYHESNCGILDNNVWIQCSIKEGKWNILTIMISIIYNENGVCMLCHCQGLIFFTERAFVTKHI